jgi:predicted RND superfamily exporter protein
MVIPWHQATMSQFKDEKAVAQAITANAERSGVYFLPAADQTLSATGPIVYAAVRKQGLTSITKELITSFVLDLISAALVMWLLLRSNARTFGARVVFVVVIALTIGVVARLGDWNWFGFPTGYTSVGVLELIIGWLLAGMVMAKFVPLTLTAD